MKIQFQWISKEYGGHQIHPFEGMRPVIRWQKYISQYQEKAWSVEMRNIFYDENCSAGNADIIFSDTADIPSSWMNSGELIELLDGYRVIAVGAILN